MEYIIKPHRLHIFIHTIFIIFMIVVADYYGGSLGFYFLVLLLVLVLALIRFKINIYDDHLLYEILLVNKSSVKKRVFPEEINQMKFTRVGWAKKAAIIKVNKGINIRLADLESPIAYDHLMEFAEKHDIPIVKTKDYLLLERMK